jgi:bisphosphoglycerate-independent phosphoglycerate mutase (AlkP superfamily)
LHALGYVVILTADHGNVENFGPDHGVNPVQTTFAPPPGVELVPVDGVKGAAKLFDLPHSVLELWGLREVLLSGVEFPFPEVSPTGFRAIGRPLVTVRSA